MSQPFKLYRLQLIDTQLDRVHTRLQEIELALSEDEALRLAQAHAEAVAAQLQDQQKALRQAERAVQDQRVKIEQTEAMLYSGKVRNPKELQDMQNELAALKRYRSVLEDRQLEAMLAVEEAETAQTTASAELEKEQARSARQHQELHKEQLSLQKDMARLEEERHAAISSISEDDLRLYEQLRRSRRGVAVAIVTDKACSACGSTLSATLLQASRSPNQITRCEMCGRILYAG